MEDTLNQHEVDGTEVGTEGTNEGPSPEVINKAKAMGWIERENFRGDPERFVDADEFIRRGEDLMPILKANNRQLQERLNQTNSKNSQLAQQVQELQESMTALQKVHIREAKGRVARQTNELRLQIEQARVDREPEKVVELQQELDELEREAEALEEEPTPVRKTAPTQVDDVQGLEMVRTWQDETEWFEKDRKMTMFAKQLAAELRKDPQYNHLVGRPYLDEIARQTETEFNYRKSGVNRTSGGSNSGARSTPSATARGKSFGDLPAEAQAACLSDTRDSRLVGPNRAFKTADDYKKYYAKLYFGEQENV